MARFYFHCGQHKGIVEAETAGEAWRKLTVDKTEGFAPLANYYQVNNYDRRWGPSRYITPEQLDALP